MRTWKSGWSLAALFALSATVGPVASHSEDAASQAAKPEAAASQPGASSEGLAPIQIELPKPMFVGTPKNIQSPNLEKPTGKKREPFLAPKGVVDISKDKAVTTSDQTPIIGDANLLTDGDKEATDGSYVEFAPGVQWVQIDLGAEYEIYVIVVWHFHAEARVYHDVIVKIAADPDFVTNARTLFNNDHDNTAGQGVGKDKEYIESNEGKLIDAKGQKARYVRLYSNGNTSNDMNHYIEVEVFGRPAK
ncbi:MAG: discoidin domain-containing protein [Candidatus Sumerlaeota bacterium]|nr:discoidin domain-containing protein [Candidatus Sumerlaeota bacterium]